jgi:hypothetical protein
MQEGEIERWQQMYGVPQKTVSLKHSLMDGDVQIKPASQIAERHHSLRLVRLTQWTYFLTIFVNLLSNSGIFNVVY